MSWFVYILQYKRTTAHLTFIQYIVQYAPQISCVWCVWNDVLLLFSNRPVKHWAAANQFDWSILDSCYRYCWCDQLSTIICWYLRLLLFVIVQYTCISPPPKKKKKSYGKTFMKLQCTFATLDPGYGYGTCTSWKKILKCLGNLCKLGYNIE